MSNDKQMFTQEQATQIIKDAISLSVRDAKNMQNAIVIFGNHYGWTPDQVRQKFVAHCLAGAQRWKDKPTTTYQLDKATDAANVALYIDKQAASDIEAVVSN